MELVIRTASGTIIAPWGRNLSQGRLHCDKFPQYYGFLGPELVTGAASLWQVPACFSLPGWELVTRSASLWQVPALLLRDGAGTCHTPYNPPNEYIEKCAIGLKFWEVVWRKKRVWLRLCFKFVVFVCLVLFNSWFVFWYFRFALLW